MEEYVIELPICRVCLQPAGECVEMNAPRINDLGDEGAQTYSECFQVCTNLQINSDDGLPNHICAPCSIEMQAAYDFILKAKNSHEILLMQAEDIKPEYLLHEMESEINEASDDIIFIQMANDEEILEEESLNFGDIDIKEEDESLANEHDASQENTVNEERLEELHEEEETARRELDSTFKCNLCNTVFGNLEDLREHGDMKHVSVPFCCMTCFHRFSSKYTLSDHMKSKHEECYIKCNICETTVKRSFLRTHKRQVHRRTPFLCSACPRTFKTTTGLQIHSETHNENRVRNFECDKCHKKFLTERTYKVHARTHWHREPYNCTLCDKKFLQKVNLRLHMQMHRGETMSCMYCEKQFVRKTDLSVHLRFHTGNFPYECQYCEKRFAIVSHLNYHQKRHQGIIYKCEVCDKEFMNMSGLRNHSFQHTAMPFNCAVCDKGFPTRFKIKRHLKTVHHVEDVEELERCITTETFKLQTCFEEANDKEELIDEEEQSIDV